MKTISIIVPCYNEEKSIGILYEKILHMFHSELSNYEFELIFVDDYSKDNTRNIIRQLCEKDKRVKAVFNIANFGFSRNIFSAFCQPMNGDAVFMLFGDLQDPPELLPEFIKKWEDGAKVVLGRKVKSDENIFMRLMRNGYYFIVDRLSDRKQIEHFNGYGLYDKMFVDIMKQIEDPQPYLKTIVSEYAPDYAEVDYEHRKSVRGRSNFNIYKKKEGQISISTKIMISQWRELRPLLRS